MNNKNHAPAVSLMAGLLAQGALLHLQDNPAVHGHSVAQISTNVGASKKNCPA
ncbi:hypothetical protein [Acidovorax sp. CCYZU-2555]|uniref:hypothetical protein n=1 Tax=Acidovorax sp. CCYZU-2555 TaxID=2835042 RepID=UPI001BCC06F9|nr:hypothetical protein [Acidovorax sp. CCYZU-2555]MBS7777085.1 hypothetical protein [Acidovorax sp. CCYZU-2555]